MTKTRKEKRYRRRKHIRKALFGKPEKPRLAVFRSNRYLYAQLIDDLNDKCICGISEKTFEPKKKDQKPTEVAFDMGKEFGKTIAEKDVNKIVFDRGGFKYHGRIRSFADGLRESGIEF